MPKRKANWWPPSILSDPDVLSVDDEGRFVLCKICHVHYAVHGGKKPKPVIMNSNFRTRAWDVHKERTNSHRMQKKQERLQQAKTQQQQQTQQPTDATEAQQQQPQGQEIQPLQGQTQTQSRPMPALTNQSQALAPPHHVQGQKATVSVTQQVPPQPLQHPWQHQQDTQLQQLELEEAKTTAASQVQTRNSAIEHQTTTAHLETVTTMAMSRINSLQSGELVNTVGKRPAHAMSVGTPTQRRRAFHAGSPGSSMQLLAESEATRRPNAHAYERHSMLVASSDNYARRMEISDHSMTTEQQADSSARWRHMHNDVSRALNVPPRRRQPSPASYTSGELRAAKTLVQTETGDLGSNNSERVAKKLRSLNAEFHASNMRHADGYNIRNTDVFDRSSAGYKEYWGTLRDVYTSSGGPVNTAPFRKTHHRSNPLSRAIQQERKEAEADSTTPDDSGSSEEALPKPAIVVHDSSLINAIERLTDATSKQVANLYQKKGSDTKEALTKLTSVMTDLRVQQGTAFERMIELQEKHLKVMEGILEIKLRKEAARNARDGCNSNESTGSSSSGSSPGDSSNTESSAPSPDTESSAISLHESN